MPSHHSVSTALPAGRTGHACAQCRHRKQKCGGFTYDIKCRPCTNRKVKCSFQEEVKDLRYNPYLRLRSSRSPSSHADRATDDNDSLHASASSAALVPALTAFDGRDVQPPLPGPLSGPLSSVPHGSPAEEGLPKQIDSLKSRVADLERKLVGSQRDHTNYMHGPPRSQPEAPFMHHFESGTTHQSYRSPPIVSLGSLSHSNPHSLSSPQGAVNTDGPLKALNSIQTDDPVESEMHDPIARSVLTEGEAHVIFRLYFSNCHPNAPFLDVDLDTDVDRVRSSSIILFIAILSIGARFWSASSRTPCWLHPRYTELVRLLDAEVMRVTLRPRHDDQKLETVQALMLCAHWMPFDAAGGQERYRSRFSEAGAWQCLGLAIRWATSLALERSCHISFLCPETVTREDVRRFRTMLYLVESDHYLALSARRPSYLNPKPLHDVLTNFLRCKDVQSTDIRLTSLFQVAYGAHFTGCRPTTIESVEAFDKDVQLIERHFTSSQGDLSTDGFGQHFPFTSLRWYRLSYACAFLDAADPTQRTGKAFTWAIEWASQILIHLSRPTSTMVNNSPTQLQLEPDPSVVDIMSFAIDHYFVVIAYAAFFLVNSWLSNLMDLNLRPHSRQQSNEVPLGGEAEPSTSLLFRLVDVAARTFEAASPPEGHLARRYAPLLRGMTGLILSGNMQAQAHGTNGDTGATMTDTSNLPPEQLQSHLGEDLWEMWQQAGLEPMIWSNLLDDL
ncbi:uncharacterized protein BJX67DRAFT_365692 [Aspergillus lucknowensis]|uniref:Zn(2)-C6 fungal-type domain-containing protein n=1 Tax=Aspergillus lucknowensis TaxID=176173 RepID=A0ABR4LDY7_9EURO